uniref:Pre-mRNA 3' end processing protein WDR33 n=1 Tax=Panagrolaimus superbus TaxID=310955 RepID=A0A914Y6C9_9BILA
MTLAWHPIHETLFVSGGGDGSIGYWLAEPFSELGLYDGAHDQAIWALDWHPLGHILSTGSNDNNTKFWGRNRPGDTLEELNGMMASAKDTHHQPINNFQYYNYQVKFHEEDLHRDYPIVPGLGVNEHVLNDMKEISILPESIPGSTTLPDDYGPRNTFTSNIGAKRTLIKQPPPKKAQRQFERTWTTTKPGSDIPEELLPASFISPPLPSNGPSTSLLGAPRTSLLPRPGGSLLGRPTIPPAILEQQSIPLQILPPSSGGESWRTGIVSPPIIIKEPPQWFQRSGGYSDGSTFPPPPSSSVSHGIGFPPPPSAGGGGGYGYDGPSIEHPYSNDGRKRRADDSEDPSLNGNGKIHRQY